MSIRTIYVCDVCGVEDSKCMERLDAKISTEEGEPWFFSSGHLCLLCAGRVRESIEDLVGKNSAQSTGMTAAALRR